MTTDATTNTPPQDLSIQSTIPKTMRAVVAAGYGTPEVLAVREIEVPQPSNTEVLIKVEASSLNALDWHFLTGTPYFLRLVAGLRRPKRTIPGADVAGRVMAVGADVSHLHVGDAVFGESEGGGCSQYVTVDENHLVVKPEAVSFNAAGATPVAGLTALQGLRTHAAVKSGDRVLINGAAGGVGTFAVQIAVALGAEVTAVCSSRNTDRVRSLGASQVIDYTAEDFVSGGERFDVMIDVVGNRTAGECLSVLVPEARYVAISGPKTNRWLGPVPHIARTALAFRRSDRSFHQFTASANIDDLTFLGELVASGQVVPQVQRTVGLDEVADGLAEIGTGHARAKIVVLPR